MIVATAGHVDHGKTALVRALTGVDTDRLEEEKRRGLTIDLGYAYLRHANGLPIGFIDVPGHRRFINNMIAGIGGIDLGMLVIAADDGPMPQTREHLDALQLLGVSDIVVALSKIDRVTKERLAQVETAVRELAGAGQWPDREIFPVCSVDGRGVGTLRDYLLQRSAQCGRRRPAGHFRLPIDRAFSLKGAGLIVTGTASAGTVQVGDPLNVLPGNRKVRVRHLRVHDREAEVANAGQRCALNLAGDIAADDTGRGDWLVAAGATTRAVDTRCTLLAHAPFALRHLTPVKVHLGAARITGRIALLDAPDGTRLRAGETCLAQLMLDREVSCIHGDRFLLRDFGETAILGAGHVLDPFAPRSGKMKEARLAWLRALDCDAPEAALANLLRLERPVNLDRFAGAWNLTAGELDALPKPASRLYEHAQSRWLASAGLWHRVTGAIDAGVQQWHRQHPHEPGITVSLLKKNLQGEWGDALLVAALTARLRDGALLLHEGRLRQPAFVREVPAEERARWTALRDALETAGNEVPRLGDIARDKGLRPGDLEQAARQACKQGRLHRLSGNRYAMPAQLGSFAAALLAAESRGVPLSPRELKRHMGVGRNLAVAILEHFDAVGFTRRAGDVRVVLDRDLPGRLYRR